MAEEKELSFEDSLTRLETIIEELDEETNSLEEAIELYEEGILLAKQCTEQLEDAELRIKEVNREQDE